MWVTRPERPKGCRHVMYKVEHLHCQFSDNMKSEKFKRSLSCESLSYFCHASLWEDYGLDWKESIMGEIKDRWRFLQWEEMEEECDRILTLFSWYFWIKKIIWIGIWIFNFSTYRLTKDCPQSKSKSLLSKRAFGEPAFGEISERGGRGRRGIESILLTFEGPHF